MRYSLDELTPEEEEEMQRKYNEEAEMQRTAPVSQHLNCIDLLGLATLGFAAIMRPWGVAAAEKEAEWCKTAGDIYTAKRYLSAGLFVPADAPPPTFYGCTGMTNSPLSSSQI